MADLVPATYFNEIKKVWTEQISDPEFLVYFYDAVADPIRLTSTNTKDVINITKAKASYIMNRKSGGNIHQDIRDHVNDDKVNETIVSYFKDKIVKHIRPLSIPDLLARLRTIISRDLNVRKETKSLLLSLADNDHLAEFLAKTYQYVVPLENVLPDGVTESQPEDIISMNKNNPLPKEEYDETPASSEKRYIDALVVVYAEMDDNPSYNVAQLMSDQKHLEHFKRQRSDYFAAEAVRRGTRDIYGSDEPDQFEILQDETYNGVIDTYEEDYKNGISRLRAVLAQASSLLVDQCWLSRDTVWIGNAQKKGVCHFLVNGERLDGWVKHDED